MAQLSEWLQLMLAEIARKEQERRSAELEQRKRDVHNEAGAAATDRSG